MSANLNKSLVPQIIAWESTRACRYTCAHCRAKSQTEADSNQLTTSESFKLIDEISEFAKPIFIISGGDPLLRSDIFKIAARANQKGLKPVMSPSGSNITNEVVKKMISSGIRRVSISLDGSNPEIHDGFRKVEGAFNLSNNGIHRLNENNLTFQINTTVTQHNLHDLNNIRNLVTKLGAVAWDIFMLVPTGRAKIKMEITPEEYESVLYQVYEWSKSSLIPIKMTCAPHYIRVIAQKKKESKSTTYNSNLPTEKPITSSTSIPNSHRRNGGRGCMAGSGFCFISHIGDVFGCGFLPIKAGNIRENHFRNIYIKSSLFNSLRNYDLLQGKCGICEYKRLCRGCRARAFGTSQNYLGEEPYCTYQPTSIV